MVSIFVGAVIFSIWLIILFIGKSIGLSMILFTVPITLFIIHILEKNKKIVNKKAKLLIIPIAFLSSTYFIYNNVFFNIINIFVIPILVMIMIFKLFDTNFKYNFNLILKLFKTSFYPLGYTGDALEKANKAIKEKINVNSNSYKKDKFKKIVKAILITLPIAIFIIILLSSADQVFGNIFKDVLDNIFNAIGKVKVSGIIARIMFTFCAFIYLISFFYYIIFNYKNTEKIIKEKIINKDNFTIKMILGVLNIIYLVFCGIQIKSLFIITDDIILSHYAREGFFQLMIVSMINLVTILIAKRSENREEKKKDKFITIMNLIMILFTFIILISAAIRMYLYESTFGYTFLRLLVYCILFAEAMLLIPTVLYVINKKINLSRTYFAIVLTIYICMNFANFDYIIAKRNVDRYEKTGKIDIDYLIKHTNTDAVSQMIRVLNKSEEMTDDKAKNGNNLKRMYDKLNKQDMDFRDYNISKIYAKHLIESNNIQNTQYTYKVKENRKEKNSVYKYNEQLTQKNGKW